MRSSTLVQDATGKHRQERSEGLQLAATEFVCAVGERRRRGTLLIAVRPGALTHTAGMSFRRGYSDFVSKDGREWRLGSTADVAWIQESTTITLEITSAIPTVFAAYATVVDPHFNQGMPPTLEPVLRRLREHSPEQQWWLGYLVTGGDDLPFPDAPRVTMYANWNYVLVLAGPDEALTWGGDLQLHRGGPDLVFPVDRSWLVSWLWDDDWLCLGGPSELIEAFIDSPEFEARRVGLGEDATPPGHVAY